MKKQTKQVSMNTHPFRECVLRDPYLAALRSEYARKSPTKRRAAADWEYHSSIATRMFNAAIALTGAEGLPSDDGFDGCIALAIEAGRLDEAKSVLEQSVALSPAEYVCSRNNLKTVLTALAR